MLKPQTSGTVLGGKFDGKYLCVPLGIDSERKGKKWSRVPDTDLWIKLKVWALRSSRKCVGQISAYFLPWEEPSLGWQVVDAEIRI